MDINDFFHNFFGFPRMPPDRYNHPFHDTDEDFDESQNTNNLFPDDDFSNMFSNIENMFNSMFSINPGFLDFPSLEMAPAQENPRDLMLKSPDATCENCSQPTIISLQNPDPASGFAKFGRQGLGIHQGDNQEVFAPKPISFSKSFSSQIIRSGNGVVEEHHTSTDKTGKTVTTVRKSVGDQTYQVVTESDKTGVVEKREEFINIDEKSLPDFEDKLQQQKSRIFGFPPRNANQDMFQRFKVPFREPISQPVHSENENVLLPAPPGDPKYQSLFKKLFGL